MPATCMCPNINCRKVVSVPDETRGRIVRCMHCQTPFRVPPAKLGNAAHASQMPANHATKKSA
jgi:hypothetical protein